MTMSRARGHHVWLLAIVFCVGATSAPASADYPVAPDVVVFCEPTLQRLGRYNAVQKVFYWGVLAAILVTILSGLSIWKPVQLQWLTWLFGSYEFVRVVHLFGMAAIVAFLVVHIALTILVPKTLVAMVFDRASAAPHRPQEAAND
jgi:thiosulfate reductase cytochrome b subunit